MVLKNRLRVIIALAALPIFFSAVFCRQVSEAQRLNELRRLLDELRLTDSSNKADVTVIMSERTMAEAAKQMVGLEIVMSNGNVLRLTSVDVELKTAAAVVKIGVNARSTVSVNMLLTGRLGTGEIRDNVFQMPFQITEVSLTSSRFTSFFLKKLLGDWLTAGKWNKELPPIAIPLEIEEAMDIPASQFNVEGSTPIEISTPAYRSNLRFAVVSLFVLDKRIALRLGMIDGSQTAGNNRNKIRTSYLGNKDQDLSSLETEVERMSAQFKADGDIRVQIDRRVINRLLEQIAAAQTTDFNMLMKPGRLRAEEVDTLVKITNYTDIQDGNGRGDINRLNIDHISNGKLILRLGMQGEADVRLRGREYGIPYRLSPHTTFSIKDRIVPLEMLSEGERMILRASSGASLPINLRFTVKVAGRDVGINRTVLVQVDRWLNRIEVPSFFGRELSLPRKLEVDAGGNLKTTKNQQTNFTLSRMRVIANDDGIDMTANVAFSPRSK